MARLANVILIWPGTHASIPSGWTRETGLDDYFPKGAAAATVGDTTGGANTHTHTSPAHSHTMIDHAHNAQMSNDGPAQGTGGGSGASVNNHVHATVATNAMSGGTLSDAITYQSASNVPPYNEVIFIKGNDNNSSIQPNIVGLYDSSSLPSGWANCDATGGTTLDLRNKYLKGATTGANAGGSGGALTHSHTVDHTHTSVGHTHSGTYGPPESGNVNGTGGGSSLTSNVHTHSVSLNSNSESGGAYTGTAGSAETVEPLYKKLLAIENISSAVAAVPVGLIGMWLGAIAAIPLGWTRYTAMDGYHLKIATDTSEIGNTGGSNTHTHAASNSHTHTATGAHSHSGSISFTGTDRSPSGGGDNASQGHSHALFSVSSNTSSWNATTIQADSSNNEPVYKTVIFIKFTHRQGGGQIY